MTPATARMPTILLTGATGYIGSHTWLALQQAGFAINNPNATKSCGCGQSFS